MLQPRRAMRGSERLSGPCRGGALRAARGAHWLAGWALPLLTAAGPVQRFEAVEPHMGTLVRITLYASGQHEAQDAFRAAFQRIGELDEMLSDYRTDSELNRVSVAARLHPVRLSTDLARVLEKAQAVAGETDGAFDVTLGPLTHLWRQARAARRVPDAGAIREARARCGYRYLVLDPRGRTLAWRGSGDLQLDLGGIAKGYAADEALRVLAGRGIRSALVAASGDLAFSNAPPGEGAWKIGLGGGGDTESGSVLLLENAAVSTSGDSEQHLEAGARRYSHIIDPRTGLGLVGAPTVTVVASRGLDADPSATALSVLGCKQGMAYAERHALAVLMIAPQGEGNRVLTSSAFQHLSHAGP